MKRYYIIILIALCLSGCRFPDQNTEKITNTNLCIAQEMSQASLYHAKIMQQQKNYQSAIIEYRKILDSNVSDLENQQARLGIAQCLLKLQKFTSAISGLNPLPLQPKSDLDSQILAVTGEAMLHLGQYEEAESILEIALSNTNIFSLSKTAKQTSYPIKSGNDFNTINIPSLYISSYSRNLLETTDSTPMWIAPCSANLGYAYLKNKKPIAAILLYENAAELYREMGNLSASQKAKNMAVNIETIIKQYGNQ